VSEDGPSNRPSIRTRLVDIAVLTAVLTLLALIMWKAAETKRRPQKWMSTSALISRIATGLDLYREDTGSFPPDFVPAGTRLRCFTKDDTPPWAINGPYGLLRAGHGRGRGWQWG
jgi:hypothetical protein